jgi:RNA polymerase sigma factor (sigma-70 family)
MAGDAAAAEAAVARRIDAVWRIERAKIVGGVARVVHDVGLAEDLAQEALIAALEHWPLDGVPDNPGAWLMAAAKNKALDHLRAQALHALKQQKLGADADARGDHVAPDFVDALDAARADEIGDDLLRLIFTACHPVLGKDAQTALTLKLIGGLSTDEIARAYVAPEPTIAQRIVRAKKTLAAARVPFEVPRGEALHGRLAAVLEVVYLIFNEGYTATSGDDWMRASLCDEALRLARMLAQLAPREAEAQALSALLEIQASRQRARVDAHGRPILLLDQDRGRWDQLLIQRGLAALERARALDGDPGPYQLQAAIAACHARARTAEATDWARIVALYDGLAQQMPSPVVALNRAVAVGMAQGPAAALPLVDALQADPSMQRYHLLPAVRADLLMKLDRPREARAEFERAAGLTRNQRERDLLLERARATLI